MAKFTIKINSVLGGWTSAQYFGTDSQYNSSLAIDPDFPIVAGAIRTSGFPVPIGYAKFSGSNVTATPISIINNPKNTLTYAVLSNGRLVSYNSSLASETLVGTVSGGVANGGTYYNNYIYIPGTTDISRYGPLNNSPSLVDSVWTGATLGSLTALTNTTYPAFRSATIPNHWMHVHPGDNALYFCDFKNGQGYINKIKTKKTTDEGDTNNGSAYQVLALPFGFYPVSIASYNITDIVIVGFQTNDTTIDQGQAFAIFWDTTNTTGFYRNVPLSDPMATAILNVNGTLNVWSGNAVNGVRISQYAGGDTMNEIVYQEEGNPPLPGAVASKGNRMVWGNFMTYPAASGVVYATNSKNARLSSSPPPIHCIATISSVAATQTVTALSFSQQSSNIQPKMVIGWRDTSAFGIDSYSASATLGSIIRFMFNVGKKFKLLKIRMPLAGAVAANTQIVPTIYLDDLSSSVALATINNTTYSGRRKIIYRTPELTACVGQNNFMLELAHGLTNPLSVALPIIIDGETFDDEPDSF